jgi:hypothetical protein
MRPMSSFVPSVEPISPDAAGGIPGLDAAVSHWTEGERSAGEWFRELGESWGVSGLAMRRGDETLGYIIYGPQWSLPHAARHPVGPFEEDAVLLAYVRGDRRARRHLLVRMLRDLRHRGIPRVEAVASDLGAPYHVSTRFLLDNGWRAVRRGWRWGSAYTLARVDLESAVEVGELARGLIGKVRLPGLVSEPAPGVFVRTARAAGRLRTARSRF